MPLAKHDQPLTRESFRDLLSWLDPNQDRAGEKYEAIRRRLITFFLCHGSQAPDEHADETIDRVARKIAAGEQVQAPDPYSYVHGVARLVMKEVWRNTKRQESAVEEVSEDRHPVVDPSADGDAQQRRRLEELRFECMQHCLGSLPRESRQLLVAYHQGARRQRIDNRNSLARQLGISINTLRIRVHRLRQELETSAEKCLENRMETLKWNESTDTSE